jgi:hypothetical protein
MELLKTEPKAEPGQENAYDLTPYQLTAARNFHAELGEEAVICLYSLYLMMNRKYLRACEEIQQLQSERPVQSERPGTGKGGA